MGSSHSLPSEQGHTLQNLKQVHTFKKEQKGLTNDQIGDKRRKIIKNIIAKTKEVEEALKKQNENDATYFSEIKKALEDIQKEVSGLKREKFENENMRFKHTSDLWEKASDVMLQEKGMANICRDIVVNRCVKAAKNEGGDPFIQCVCKCVSVFKDFSKNSDRMAEYITKEEEKLLETIQTVLVDEDAKNTEIVGACLETVRNCCMKEMNISLFVELKFIDVLLTYRKKEDFTILATESLAVLLDEDQFKKEFKDVNQDSCGYRSKVIDVLSNGLNKSKRSYKGRTCLDTTRLIRFLARNKENRMFFVLQGALELLVKLINTAKTTQEQCEGVHTICRLLLEEETRKQVVDTESLGLCNLLNDLKEADDIRIKRHANNALWSLRKELCQSNSSKYREIGQKYIPRSEEQQSSENASVTKHVMISYQWGNQVEVIQIKNELQAAGFKVWMDIEKMGGSTLKAMAEAIEQAYVVLICYSRKYRNSYNCEAELEYIYARHTNRIPVKMEPNYTPDGRLGFVCGAKLYIEFNGKYAFNEAMAKLLKELNHYKQEPGQEQPQTESSDAKEQSPSKTSVNEVQSKHGSKDNGKSGQKQPKIESSDPKKHSPSKTSVNEVQSKHGSKESVKPGQTQPQTESSDPKKQSPPKTSDNEVNLKPGSKDNGISGQKQPKTESNGAKKQSPPKHSRYKVPPRALTAPGGTAQSARVSSRGSTRTPMHVPPRALTDLGDSALYAMMSTRGSTRTIISKTPLHVVRNWTRDEVDIWLRRHNLKSSRMIYLRGREISALMQILIDSPLCFYKCLQDTIKIADMNTLSKVVWALRDLIY